MVAKRILVIDDEMSIREVVRACLERLAGWEVLTAESGPVGISTAESEPVDAILLDVSMPGMDGLTTFRKLQENEKTRSLPVILLTAKVQPSDQGHYSELGVAGLVTKPFDPIGISNQISELLGWI
jgi:CheY-like chemotaxis protein